jgi:hypothetical protein
MTFAHISLIRSTARVSRLVPRGRKDTGLLSIGPMGQTSRARCVRAGQPASSVSMLTEQRGRRALTIPCGRRSPDAAHRVTLRGVVADQGDGDGQKNDRDDCPGSCSIPRSDPAGWPNICNDLLGLFWQVQRGVVAVHPVNRSRARITEQPQTPKASRRATDPRTADERPVAPAGHHPPTAAVTKERSATPPAIPYPHHALA